MGGGIADCVLGWSERIVGQKRAESRFFGTGKGKSALVDSTAAETVVNVFQMAIQLDIFKNGILESGSCQLLKSFGRAQFG